MVVPFASQQKEELIALLDKQCSALPISVSDILMLAKLPLESLESKNLNTAQIRLLQKDYSMRFLRALLKTCPSGCSQEFLLDQLNRSITLLIDRLLLHEADTDSEKIIQMIKDIDSLIDVYTSELKKLDNLG
jgi:hypothetical protein